MMIIPQICSNVDTPSVSKSNGGIVSGGGSNIIAVDNWFDSS